MSYSIDLRERVIKFIENGGSKMEAVRTFSVCRVTIYSWLKKKAVKGTLKDDPPKRGWKTIKINANNFYALSWIIAELGYLKDQGLKIHAITEALEHEGIMEGSRAIKKAQELSGQKKVNVRDLLSQAESITNDFVTKHHVLDKLENDIARYL